MHLNSFRDFAGYWGPVTSSIDWCEPNYVHSHYVAEFWNSFSSYLMSVGGLVGIYWVYKTRMDTQLMVYSLMLTVVGIGSALYHGTLLFHTQMLDELPMIYCMSAFWYTWMHVRREMASRINPARYGGPKAGCQWFETVYVLRPFTRLGRAMQALPRLGWLLHRRALAMCVYNVCLSLVHVYGRFTVLFQVHFGLMIFVGLLIAHDFTSHWRHDPAALKTFKRYLGLWVVLSVSAFACWIADNTLCSSLLALPVYPQLHAWWHVLCGGSTYTLLVANAIALNMVKRARLIGVDCDRQGRPLGTTDDVSTGSDAALVSRSKQGTHNVKASSAYPHAGRACGCGDGCEFDIEAAQFVTEPVKLGSVRVAGWATPYTYVRHPDGRGLD